MRGQDELADRCRDYLAHLRVERGLSSNTLSAYTRDLARYRAFLASLGRSTVAQISEADIRSFLQAIRTGTDGGRALASASAARCLIAVRGWHQFLVEEGVCSENPSAQVHPPAAGERLPKALTVEQVAALINAASINDSPVALRDRALLELLYATGGRISEIVGLTVDDCDRETGTIRLFGKGRKERIVPVGSYAWAALDAYLVQGRPSLAAAGDGVPEIFLNTRGRALSRQSAWGVLKTVAGRAGMDPETISPHTMRHSYATHMLSGGADVRVVQELLGHASVTTTQIYTKVTVDHLREVYATSHPRAQRSSASLR